MTFRQLAKGDWFTFDTKHDPANPPRATCQKIGPNCYTWHSRSGLRHSQRIGPSNVKVIRLKTIN